MTTADDETTKAVLDEGGYTYYEGESILAEVDDRPGGMARVARELADAGVNIYGHLFLGRWGTGRCSPSWSTIRSGPGRSSNQGLIQGRSARSCGVACPAAAA